MISTNSFKKSTHPWGLDLVTLLFDEGKLALLVDEGEMDFSLDHFPKSSKHYSESSRSLIARDDLDVGSLFRPLEETVVRDV